MGSWTKNVGEKVLVGKNWTLDLNGALLTSTMPPEVPDGATFTLEQLLPQGSTTRYWLDGGEAGETATVVIAINTSEGELLNEYVRVSIV